MTILGINTDPARYLDDLAGHVAELKAAGYTMARFPLRSDGNGPAIAQAFCAALRGCDVTPLPVYANESRLRGNASQYTQIDFWGRALPCTQFWQIGNESDHRSPSSWTMQADDFSRLLRDARDTLPDTVFLIAGGMVSGHPEYLDTVDLSHVDAIAVHPYAKGPEAAAGLIREYQRFSKPIWVTEFGATLADMPHASPEERWECRRDYYSGMVRALAPLCEAVIPFCWHDYAGFGIGGTTVADGIRVALAEPVVPPSNGGMMDQYTIDDETRGQITNLGWTPASDYVVTGGGGYVLCSQGILWYLNGPALYRHSPFDLPQS